MFTFVAHPQAYRFGIFKTAAVQISEKHKSHRAWTSAWKSIACRYYLVLFLALLVCFSFLATVTYNADNEWSKALWHIPADSLIITFLCACLRGKWKMISLIVPWFLSILIFAIIVYYRNFSDFIPPSQYFGSHLSDVIITESVASSSRWYDLILVIASASPLLFFIFSDKKEFFDSNIGKRGLWTTGLCTLLIWVIPYCVIYSVNAVRKKTLDFSENLGYIFPDYALSWKYFYNNNGFSGYILKCLTHSDEKRNLAPEEIEMIRKHFSSKPKMADFISIRVQEGEGKEPNLIVIVVESLPYIVFEIEEAETVMPNLFKMVRQDEVIIKKTKSLAMLGRSSDAQFMYNTGLYPLRDEPLVVNYPSNDYPSLAKALNRHSVEIIGENKGLWSHEQTSRSYGFDEFYSDLAPDGPDQDSVIFSKAISILKDLKQPFFSVITTLTMHSPFDSPKVSHPPVLQNLSTSDPRDREYLGRLAYFDRCLMQFLDELKENGLFDDSVIIIVGDHEIGGWNVSPYLTDESGPLIILNSPVTTVRQSEATQLDFFPTVLDLMNVHYKFIGVDYRGLGKSIFNDSVNVPAHDLSDDDVKVSEMIIRSNNIDQYNHVGSSFNSRK